MRKSFLLKYLITPWMKTLFFEVSNDKPVRSLINDRKPFVLVFWHGSMLYTWWRFRHHNMAALVSMSRDGEILSDLLKRWGYHVVRGSSSRGGKDAMAKMRQLIQKGYSLCITPDGPRGPRHEMKMGALRAAQSMQVPIIAMAIRYKRSKELRSWDHFEIPVPFTTARIVYSDAIFFESNLEGVSLEQKRLEFEEMMRSLNNDAHFN